MTVKGRHIVLVGPMASGKTTLGRMVAEQLDRSFIDSDEQLLRRHGMTGRELAARDGVPALHAAEVEAFTGALATEQPAVVAAAAAVADSAQALAALADSEAFVVVLEGATSVLFRRLGRPLSHRRPMSRIEFEQQTARRRSALRAVEPDLVVDTSQQDPEESANRIFEAMGVAAS